MTNRTVIASTALTLSATSMLSAQDVQEALNKMRNLNAVQIFYREGVPHTDKNGRLLMKYDPNRSFFQIGIWGNPIGLAYGVNYDLKVLVDAGFNTMWPWPIHSLEASLEAGEQYGLQVVQMWGASPEQFAEVKDHPNLLGHMWTDEPTGSFWGKDMDGKYREFLDHRKKVKAVAPHLPVFVNDCPWITEPATHWWVKWNTAGDVECHDNYPILNRRWRARSIGNEESKTGIPRSVAFAVAVNQEKKPVWLIVGAFRVRGAGSFPFRFPTPMQLRAQVYAGLIHGVTGIIYFCWDTYVSRDGNVIGMSPEPKVQYIQPGPNKPRAAPAKPIDLATSKALWLAAAQINKEIRELTPLLLSPTAGDEVKYTVNVKGQAITDNPLRCILKPHPDGGYVLPTVNLDDAVLNVTYKFPAGLKTATPLFENRDSFKIEDGQKTFSDRYEPFDVHVYRVISE